jgi:hypothetical protein
LGAGPASETGAGLAHAAVSRVTDNARLSPLSIQGKI